jgi:hypothetical protein
VSTVAAAPAVAARWYPRGTRVASSIATLISASASARDARGGLVPCAAISASSAAIQRVTASDWPRAAACGAATARKAAASAETTITFIVLFS